MNKREQTKQDSCSNFGGNSFVNSQTEKASNIAFIPRQFENQIIFSSVIEREEDSKYQPLNV